MFYTFPNTYLNHECYITRNKSNLTYVKFVLGQASKISNIFLNKAKEFTTKPSLVLFIITPSHIIMICKCIEEVGTNYQGCGELMHSKVSVIFSFVLPRIHWKEREFILEFVLKINRKLVYLNNAPQKSCSSWLLLRKMPRV